MSKMNRIEVDDDVFQYLQDNANAFVDSPNDVLRRLLLDSENSTPSQQRSAKQVKGQASKNVDAFVIELLAQEFKSQTTRRGRYRLMFETANNVIYVQNFNKVSDHLWYRITNKPWKELREVAKDAFICFTNPPERFAYVIPVKDIEARVATVGYGRDFLEVNIDPVSSRWVELEWIVSKYRKVVPKAEA